MLQEFYLKVLLLNLKNKKKNNGMFKIIKYIKTQINQVRKILQF